MPMSSHTANSRAAMFPGWSTTTTGLPKRETLKRASLIPLSDCSTFPSKTSSPVAGMIAAK